ncbi:putative Hybrid PKS-NRPS biosynthetic cluster [Aspergillus tubingensis]|nr:putative Hybrid PKS-NRPS biosynthetic cluster [Aspergillus tubingensis]
MSASKNEPIAIVGSACRFPGDATSPSKLWELLKEPREVARPIDRFAASSFYHQDGHYHGASNVRDAYLLSEDPRYFDAQFFNIPPGEADSIDPQQRTVLETVYEAVESSGLVLEDMRGSDTAVYVGVMCDDYGNICYVDQEAVPTYAATGTARSILSNRVSFTFDWRGPSMTIDTACSSSLVAIHQSVQVLRSGNSNIAVAAGANLIFSPNMFIAESNLNMLSPTGKSQMWDANANGYARGEGIAAVIMKRLSDAIRDGDHIECVIRETGCNQDGHTPGITMPSQEAQTKLIHDTYRRAGLDLSKPEDRPQYFEAHGTGTKAGDGVESKAIYHAFFPEGQTTDESLWVGSIKTIIGHTEGTAGIAGVMKASLAIQNKTIPPNLHLKTLNPEIIPYYGKLQIAKTAQDWPALPAGAVRRASINSFGFGGTNAHAIIEAYEPEASPVQAQAAAKAAVALPLTFSATTETSLTNLMAKYLEYLTENPDADLTSLAFTLHDRRSTFAYRSHIAGQSVDEILPKLQKAVEEQQSGNSASIVRGTSAKKHLLGVFTGQGAQWATMGRELIRASKLAQDIIGKLEQSLAELPASDRPSWSLMEQLMADPAQSRIAEGELSQPLCTAVQIVLVEVLKLAGITFDVVVGHSSGEIGAAYAAGFFNATDAIRIAFYRGRYAFMAKGREGQKGGMLAAGTTLEDALELVELPAFEGRVSVAAYNSDASVTLSGDLDAIEEVKEVLDDERVFNRQLKVDTAYHSHHMIPCSAKYYEALNNCNVQILKPSSETKWYSSVYDGKLMEPCEELKHTYWIDNMVNIVLFATALKSALNKAVPQPTQVIEVGPHPALKGPASNVIEDVVKAALPYTGTLARGQNDVNAVASTLGYLWAQFGRSSADWKGYSQAFSSSIPTILHELPSYPWNHDRLFWYEARKSRVNRLRQDPAHVLLGTRTDSINEREYRWRNYISSKEIPWLSGHSIQGQTLFPAAGFLVMAVEAARIVGRDQAIHAIELQDSQIHRALAVNEDKGIETLFTLSNVTSVQTGSESSTITANFACDACLQKGSDVFTSIASGKLVMSLGTPSSTALVEYPKEAGLGMLDVDCDEFYAYLASIGYNYADLFRGITSMSRCCDLAQGEIITSTASQSGSMEEFLLHPSTLDVAFQAIFAAISYPGDGALWALHIPTTIRRVVINPVICPMNGGLDEKVRFSATSNRADDGTFSGCVDIFPVHSDHSLCQVEGLEVSPVSPPTAKDDRHMFGHTNRWLSTPDAEAVAKPVSITTEQEQEHQLLDRLALQELRKIVDSGNSAHAHLRTWAQGVLKVAGTDSATEQIDSSSVTVDEAFAANLAVLKALGSGHSGLLNKFYASAFGAAEARSALISLVHQISRRYPHMRILELGAGNGAATKPLLETLGALCSAYTVTDSTDEHFAALKEVHGDDLFTQTLDLDQDLEEQGFSAASFDLIVAPNGLHNVQDRDQAMQKLRWLTRPGGFLFVQQITNVGAAHVGLTVASLTSQTEVPELSEYDAMLQEAGFSGIDSVTPDSVSPFSVFVSQAVDGQINAIRAPLSAGNKTTIDQILLIGGRRFQTSRLIANIKNTLAQFCGNITSIQSMREFKSSMLASRPLVLSLTELDEPFFQDLTDQKYKALQTLFFRSRYVVWATHGANGDNPYANVMKGVVRCLLIEIPHLHCQMFNIEGKVKIDQHATVLAEQLLRLHIADGWKDKIPAYSPLWTSERELMLSDDKLHITRYDSEPELNDHYNVLRRRVVADVSTADRVIALTADKRLQQFRLNPQAPIGTEKAKVFVNVEKSLSTAIKVGDLGYLYLSIGTNKETRETVLALTDQHQSLLTVPESRLLAVNVAAREHRTLLVSVAATLLASALLEKSTASDRLVFHEAPTVLAELLREKARKTGAQLVFTTADKEATGYWQHVHAYSPGRELSRLVQANTSLFVNFSPASEGSEVVNRLKAQLPFRARYRTLSDYLPSQSVLYSDSTEAQLAKALKDAHDKAVSEASSVAFGQVTNTFVQQLAADQSLGEPLTTLDWTDPTPFPASLTLAMDEVRFRSDRTYFLVGMTGSLGLSTCEFMMERGARHFALSSRRPNIDQRWLNKVETNFGASVKAYPLNVTSRESLQEVYKEICATQPPIAGVANAALIMRDGLFMESNATTMNEALGPKIDGTIYLDELFANVNLDFFILFSSLVYITGNIGQTSYAAGNGFMVSLAHQRRQRGQCASVMNLGGINGIGYITRTDHNILNRLDIMGYGIMSELDYKYFFAEAVMAGPPDSGRDPEVSAGLKFVNPKTDKNPPKWWEDPKFSHYVIDKSAREGGDKGAEGALSTKAQLQEAATDKDAFNIILTALQAMLHKKLGLLPSESVLSDVAIVEMGVDSLVAVDMRSWFSSEFDHDIPIIKILGGATLADLVEDTVANLSPSIAPNLGGTAAAEEVPKLEVETPTEPDTAAPSEDEPSFSELDTPATTDIGEGSVTGKSTADEKVEAAAAPVAPAIVRPDFVRVEKMTHGCSRFWFLRQYLEDASCFNIIVRTRLTGQVDVARVQEAVRKVGARHEALRTAYYVDEEGEPMMGVMPDSKLRLEISKIADVSEAEKAHKEVSKYNFDIENGEVIRMQLLTVGPREHHLIFAVHHIAIDGFSFNLMIRDMDMFYQGKPVPQIASQFTDLAIQQRKDIESGRLQDDIVFWKKIYTTLPDPLPLFPFPGVGARLPQTKYEHEEVEMVLDSAIAQKIRTLCRQNRCTTFHFFLATFRLFLTRWLEVDDLCIGIADANRKDIKTLATVGFLLNLIPLRFGGLTGKETFSALLNTAKQTSYSALNHSALPFDLLLQELEVPRSSSHSPMFQAFLDYRQLSLKTPPMLESQTEGESNFGATAYDVVLDVTDDAASDITIKWQTQKSLYNGRHTQAMMDSYMHLLHHCANGPAGPIASAPLYRDEHITAAIEAGRGPQFDSEWPETLSLKVDQVSAQFPNDIALRDGLGDSMTYKAMDRIIDQISEELVQTNIQPGDKVGVFQQPSAMWICSLLAIWRSGAVYVPLDPRNGLPRLAATCSVVEPSSVLCDSSTVFDVARLALPAGASTINVDQVRKANDSPARRPNLSKGDSSAIIVSSSGSTGVPKGIEVRHQSLLNLFEGDGQIWNLGRPNCVQQSAYSFDISLDQIFTSLVNGGNLYVASQAQRSDPQAMAELIANNQITYTMATPSEYSNWINYAAPTLSKATSWRRANVGGEGWNATLRDSFATLNLPNLKIQNCYGPAENSVWCTRQPIDYPSESTLIPAGPALPNYSFYIVDKQLDVVPTGVQGEILIGGAGTAVGYYKRTDLTNEKFIEDKNASSVHVAKGWNRAYRTGDKGYLMDDGTLVVLGRITGDTQIKLRGFRIELEDIEATIVRASNGVLSRVVANVRGEGHESYLVGFVEFADGYPTDQQKTYLAQLLNKVPLPQYMKPNMLIPLDRIPLNSHGKVNRLAIATIPIHPQVDAAEISTEVTDTEKAIWELWQEILPQSVMDGAAINLNHDFFQLGGNSLLTVRLQSRIREAFGIVVPLHKVIESSKLSALGALLDEFLANSRINWDLETALTDEMLHISPADTSSTTRKNAQALTVILTGASGFIGRHILERLIQDPKIGRVHCIAHRPLSDELPHRQKFNAVVASSSKISVHEGDLSAPRLGLSETDFAALAQQADMIIHSGANRSFFSTYDQVQAINVQSTKELALMSAASLRDHRRIVPFHFLSGSEAATVEPASDGSQGYVASKWASERFLEKYADQLRLPVHIHRQLPVPEGREAQGEELDQILQEFVDVAANMTELPDSTTWGGHYDLIPADRLSRDIVGHAFTALTSTDNQISSDNVKQYSHLSSVRMDIAKVVERLDSLPEYAQSGRPKIPAHVWVGKAKIAGFRYQFSTMNMVLQDAEGKGLATLSR